MIHVWFGVLSIFIVGTCGVASKKVCLVKPLLERARLQAPEPLKRAILPQPFPRQDARMLMRTALRRKIMHYTTSFML